MTNERNRPGTDEVRDQEVSRAYADLATERTPAHLDKAVLRKAENAAERPYRRSVLWTRPVAWAAVVAICLAITLQVTQVPVPDDIADISLMERDESAAAGALDREGLAEESGGAEQRPSATAPLLRKQLASDAPAPDAAEQRALQRTDAPEAAREPAAPLKTALEEAPSPVPEAFEMQDADMLQRAEDMARQRAGENKEAEQTARGRVAAFAPASVAASADGDRCSDSDREDPQDWLVCILLLENRGHIEQAELERKQLAEAFPDFETPATTE